MGRKSIISKEIKQDLINQSRKMTSIELKNWFDSKYNIEMTLSGFYRYLDSNKIKTKKHFRSPEKQVLFIKNEKRINRKWTKEQDLWLIREMEKKKNLNYLETSLQFNKKFEINRTYEAIKQRLSKLKLAITNIHNQNIATDYFHLKEFLNKYKITNKVLKKIIQENNIKLYKRNNFKMIHTNYIKDLEKAIQKYKDTTVTGYKKKGYLTSSQCEKYLFMSKEQIINKARQGLIEYIKDGQYYFFTKKAIDKYIERIRFLEKNYYNVKEASAKLGINQYSMVLFAKNHNISSIREDYNYLFPKEEIENYLKKIETIKKEYICIDEVVKILKRDKRTIRAYKKLYNPEIAYWNKKLYIKKEDIKRIKKEIKKYDYIQEKKRRNLKCHQN